MKNKQHTPKNNLSAIEEFTLAINTSFAKHFPKANLEEKREHLKKMFTAII